MKKVSAWYVILALYVLFIYSNSMTPAAVSSQESGFVLEFLQGWLSWLGVPALWLTEHMVRKAAHFCEYALLGLLLTQALRTGLASGQVRRLTQLFLTVFLPFVDETIQLFTPGRSAQIDDVWLDISGVVTGTVFFWIAAWAGAKIFRKKRQPRIDRRELEKIRDKG